MGITVWLSGSDSSGEIRVNDNTFAGKPRLPMGGSAATHSQNRCKTR